MALKAIVDNLDGLPADVAKEYSKGEDGKFRLQVTPVGGVALEDISGLQSALGKERENVRKATEQLAAFKDIDPAKAREALTKVGEMANWTPEQKVREQIEAAKAQLVDAHGKDRSKLETRIGGLMKQLTRAMITSAATQAIAEARGSTALLLPHVERQTRLKELENGEFAVEVMDATGNIRIGDAKGAPMTIAQLVAEMRGSDTYARAFEGSGASGSGAQNKGGGNAGSPFVLSAEDAKDPAKYRAAKEAASKAGQQLQIAG